MKFEYREIVNWRSLAELGKLLDLRKPPEKLYYRGNWNPSVFEDCVAVVGSRRMTSYGRAAVMKLVMELVSSGKTIISGYMYGVDQCAHEAALEYGGRTVAVLGWGIRWKLWGKDEMLAEKVLRAGGMFLSEWEEQKPAVWTFPIRNRIVAALSSAVYVVEAAEKSGSLITVHEAEKLGRKVFAIPGPITSRVSTGTNKLIADGRAESWLFGRQNTKAESEKSAIYLLIKEQGGLEADEIMRIVRKNIGEVGSELTRLCLAGLVVEREGKYYVT